MIGSCSTTLIIMGFSCYYCCSFPYYNTLIPVLDDAVLFHWNDKLKFKLVSSSTPQFTVDMSLISAFLFIVISGLFPPVVVHLGKMHQNPSLDVTGGNL